VFSSNRDTTAQTGQLWDDDSGFWEDPATLCAIEELTIAEVKEAEHAAKLKQSTGGGHPPTNTLRDNVKRNSGKVVSPSVKTITATVSRPSRPSQSQGIHTSCQLVT